MVGVQRCIGLDGAPAQIAGAIDDIPVFEIYLAALRADPANVGVFEEVDVGEDERVGLIGTKVRDDGVEVVLATGTARAIKPELGELTVVGSKLLEHREIVLVVCGGIFIARIVAVPRRKIDTEAQAVRAGAIRDHADEIALAAEPWAGLDAVVGLRGGIEREAVMMLGDEHDVADARGFSGRDPLIGIDMLRIEDTDRRSAVSPFAIEEGIGAEVDDGAHLHVLPGDLLRRRLHVGKVLRECGGRGEQREAGKQVFHPSPCV